MGCSADRDRRGQRTHGACGRAGDSGEEAFAARRAGCEQQLGGYGRCGRSALVQAAGASERDPRRAAADRRDQRRSRSAGDLRLHSRADRRGQQPVRRRRVRVAGRPLRLLLAAELRRRGGDRPQDAQAGVAGEDRWLPRRSHGAVTGRAAAAGVGVHRAGGRRDRHEGAQDRRGHPVGRLASREQLLPRRAADLPRQHRHGLHELGRSGSGRDEG